jgi:hypothetical protein
MEPWTRSSTANEPHLRALASALTEDVPLPYTLADLARDLEPLGRLDPVIALRRV